MDENRIHLQNILQHYLIHPHQDQDEHDHPTQKGYTPIFPPTNQEPNPNQNPIHLM